MNDKESISEKQQKMQKLTVGILRKVLKSKELHDTDEVFADYPGGWSGIFQVYCSENRLFMLASDKFSDSGIGGGVSCLDSQLWISDSLDEEE